MDQRAGIAEHLRSIGLEPGLSYAERGVDYEETGRYWIVTDAGLCTASLSRNEMRNRVLDITVTPWAAVGAVSIRANGLLAEQTGPSGLGVQIPSVGVDAKVDSFQRGGIHTEDRDELAKFAVEVAKRVT